MLKKLEPPTLAASLFADWQETLIWSCLQGVMGSIYGNDPLHPTAAVAVLGDFCFLAGEPTDELISFWPDAAKQFLLLVPQNEAIAARLAAHYGKKAISVTRYAISKNTQFDKAQLQRLALPPSPYTLRLIDAPLFAYCKQQTWCRDFVSNYPNYAAFQAAGLGVMAIAPPTEEPASDSLNCPPYGEPVAGASSYSFFGSVQPPAGASPSGLSQPLMDVSASDSTQPSADAPAFSFTQPLMDSSASDSTQPPAGAPAFSFTQPLMDVSAFGLAQPLADASPYRGGIEIELQTKEAHRRRGLATACAARLILECLARGLYPSWDAANLESVALSKKLGYQFSHTYPTFYVMPNGIGETD